MRERDDKLTPRELQRYSRQIVLDEVGVQGQLRLARARVLVVGAGGLGGPAAAYLAAAGVGVVGVVDRDRVERSNLQRQLLHDEADVGRWKAVSAAERLRAQNPDVRVVVHDVSLDSSNALDVLAPYDVVVNGSDNFPTRYLVNDACVLLGKPLVDGSLLKFHGQVTVFVPGRGCYRCLVPEPPAPGAVPSCAEGGVAGPVAGHLGALQALEAMKLLLGAGRTLAGRLLLYDGLDGTHRVVRWERDPNCSVCGEEPTVRGLVDYDAFCGLAPGRAAGRRREGASETDGAAAVRARGWSKTIWQAKAARDEGIARWLDVRGPGERANLYVPGTEPVPAAAVAKGHVPAGRDEEVYLFCLTGERSALLTRRLRRQGWDNVYNVEGGLLAWLNEGLPVVRRGAPPGGQEGSGAGADATSDAEAAGPGKV